MPDPPPAPLPAPSAAAAQKTLGLQVTLRGQQGESGAASSHGGVAAELDKGSKKGSLKLGAPLPRKQRHGAVAFPRSAATAGGSSRRCRIAVPLSGALGLHEAAAAAEGHLVVVEVRNSPGPLQPSELLGTATFPLSEVRDFRGGATAAFAAGRTTGNEEDLELWLVPPEVT